MDDEIQFCLDMETEENLRQGMSPGEARRKAHLKIGGIEQVKENCRDQRGLPWLESFLQDIHYGIRQLIRKPGLPVLIILLVALGVGASTAIFSVVKAVLLDPLPYDSPGQLTMLWEADARQPRVPSSGPDFADWREQNQSFERIVAYAPAQLTLTGQDDPEMIQGAATSVGLFELLRVQPMIGRAFTDEEELPGNGQVAIISYSLWQRRFGADPEVLGRPIMLDGVSYTLIGIMPAGFSHPCPWTIGRKSEVWKPLSRSDLAGGSRLAQRLLVMGRVKDGISIETAQQEMLGISLKLKEQYPDIWAEKWVNVFPMREDLVGSISGHIMIIQGAAAIILLIVCLNVASLLMARATTRQTEIAIRATLGAGRIRLIRQMIVENLPLSLLGGCLGILLAAWGINTLHTIIPADIPRVEDIQIDGWLLVFALGVSLLTGFLFSLVPALVTAESNLNEALRQGRGTCQSAPGVFRLRNILVIMQFALAIILTNSALLMMNSYQQLRNMDYGFSTENVLIMRLNLQGPRYEKVDQLYSFYTELLNSIEALPGVKHAAAISRLPLNGGTGSNATLEGREEEKAKHVEIKTSTAGYFQAIGITMLAGRDFTVQDSASVQPGVIINQRMTEAFWPGENPIGKRLCFGDQAWLTVIGVVADTPQWAEWAAIPEIYFPYINPPNTGLSAFSRVKYLIINTEIDPLSLVAPIREEVKRMDRNLPLSEIRTTGQILVESMAQRSFNTLLIMLFAALALILVAAGIYGTMSYHVVQRFHEIGIRMALGADQKRILVDVLNHGLKQALIGTAAGLVGVLALSRILASMLYGITPTHPLTFTVVSGLLIFVAVVACLIPARRAARVNPLESLRNE